MESGLTCSESRLTQFTDNAIESEDLDNGLLVSLDSYLQDISDRLTISRMVSDSVIKGMVNAISQLADEEIVQKELEVSELKKRINIYHVLTDENVSSQIPLMVFDSKFVQHGICSHCSESLLEQSKLRQSLGKLQNKTRMQLQNLKSEIDSIKGCSSVENLVRIEGVLQVEVSKKWTDVDIAICSLQTLLDSFSSKVEDMVCLSASLCQSQVDQEFQAEIKDVVIGTFIQCLQEEYEEKLLDQNAQSYCDRKGEWSEMMKEMLSIQKELDVALIHPENGQLTTRGSLENDPLHCKLNQGAPPAVFWEGNGKHEESNTIIADNFDPSRLKHLSRDELINYFNSEMTRMRRNHESSMHEIFEENFTLKRELLKERGPSLSLKKDKELETLRRSISDIVFKMDEFLRENKNNSLLVDGDSNNLDSFRDRISTLRLENSQLSHLLDEKKKEIKSLSSQASIAAEELSEKSCVQRNLLETIDALKCEVHDANIVSSILLETIDALKCEVHDANIVSSFIEEVYKCFFRSLTEQFACDNEDAVLQAENDLTSKEAANNLEFAGKFGADDSELESVIMQEIFEFVSREFLNDCEKRLNDLHESYIHEINLRLSIETKLHQKENALKVEVVEKKYLKQKIVSLTAEIEEKENVVREVEATLKKEREQLDSSSRELSNLKSDISGLQTLILESNKSTDFVKGNLDEATKLVELLKAEKCELSQKVEQAMDELKEVQVEKEKLLIAVQENHNIHSSIKAKERKYEEQMESIAVLAQELINGVSDIERKVTESVSMSNSRLETLTSQSTSLIQMANLLKSAGIIYKLKFERKCSDLEKAEAEVDLLGDQVDGLFDLLEKIYIGLDHYSPILKHYSGIVEILKLVKRELIGAPTKST